ncbi:MAG: trypsin-like serine protease [Chloroflexi bacterium]|nr:trypsin-like serine protease [Chloroflexota bacterium]
MIPRKYLIFVILPLMLVVLACTCSGQDIFLVPTPNMGSPNTPAPIVIIATPSPLPEDAIAEVDAEDALLVNLYQRVNPAVVYIQIMVDDGETMLPLGSGSGFVIDTKGHIVTNAHVVEDASAVQVTFSYDNVVADAEIIGHDPYSDLAVIKVDVSPEQLVPLELGNSSALQVGQRVIAIGNPFGLEGTMTVGIISALGRTLPAQILESSGRFSNPEIIQTDASINPGNSGGPLLDTHGRVIGVNTAIRSETGVNSGVGFSVPINTLKRVLPQLIEEGTYHYPYLGITSSNFFSVAELAEPLGLLVSHGVLIAEVIPGTGAARGGLQGGDRQVEVMGVPIMAGGDIIIAIDGTTVIDYSDFIAYLVRETQVDQTIVLTVVREGEEVEVPVTLGER